MPEIEKETRTAPLGLRLTPSLKAALEKAAAEDHRAVASYVEKLLTEHLRATGHLQQPERPSPIGPGGFPNQVLGEPRRRAR